MELLLAIAGKCLARSRRRGLRAAIHAGAVLLPIALSGAAAAQQAAHQPAIDPHQAERNFDAMQTEQRRAKGAAIGVPRTTTQQTPADTRPLFRLADVIVDGASAIPAETIAATYRPYIGKTVSQADLVAIAGKISELYRAASYHLSRAIVPPQDIKNGRVRVQVIEGRIAEIVVNGRGADRFGVGALLAPVTKEQPSRLPTVERQLLLVNDRPGVRVADTALEEIGTATGNFRLIVTVETWQIYAAQGFDNLSSLAIGPWQTYSAIVFNSNLIAGDTLGVNLSTTPTAMRELKFGRVFYDAPVGTDGVRLGASALYSEAWPGDVRRLFGSYTQTETYEIRGSFTPLQSRTSSLWLTGTAGYSDVSGRDSIGIPYSDHLRTATVTADYRLQDDFGGWNYVTALYRQGFDGLGATQFGDLYVSRPGASGVFSVFDFLVTRYQTLSDLWSLKFSVSGQLASTVLLTSQQFYLGSAAYGPGYYEGDNGIAGSAELRFDQVLANPVLKGYQLYGFIDRGAVWNVDSRDTVLSLSSVGVGVRLYLADQLQAGLAVAFPLRYRTTENDVRDARILFSLSNTLKVCPDRPQMRCL
jgi:hemolysin activation/secretion protein